MARIRSIKPEFPQSESMGRVSRDSRLLFVQLWTICDDHGRARAHSRMLASLLFPYDDDAGDLIDGWLSELEKEGCIRIYEVRGSRYLQITGWTTHQKIDKPSKPQYPGLNEVSEETREDSRDPLESAEKIRLGREGKGEEGKGGDLLAPSPSDSTPETPPVAKLILNDKTFHVVTQADVERWQDLYPKVDIVQEARKMAGWCEGNPRERKTKTGVSRFVTSWLARAQDRGGSSPPMLNGHASSPPAAADERGYTQQQIAAMVGE